MQILIGIILSAVAMAATFPPIKRSDPVLVRAVIDGDTIDVAPLGRVRLLGIDAPEVGHGFDTSAPFGREARDRLASLVLRRWVRLEQEGPALDAYNRHLAYVLREDGLFVNAALVRDGLARVTARIPLARLPELKKAEAEAQTFRRGMWGAAPQTPSASYTRRPSGARPRAAKPGTSRKKAASTRRTKKRVTSSWGMEFRGSDSC